MKVQSMPCQPSVQGLFVEGLVKFHFIPSVGLSLHNQFAPLVELYRSCRAFISSTGMLGDEITLPKRMTIKEATQNKRIEPIRSVNWVGDLAIGSRGVLTKFQDERRVNFKPCGKGCLCSSLYTDNVLHRQRVCSNNNN